MTPIVRGLLAFAASLVRSRVSLQLEILALRHQLTVYQRWIRRPRVRPSDRIFWSGLARRWARWREGVVFGHPATVLAWQRTRFRAHGARLRRTRRAGRPAVSKEIRALIREVSAANPRWGSPRILCELRKLGSAVAKSTIEKYRVRHRSPPSPTWRVFLKTNLTELVALDFFTVPTVGFKVLFVLIVRAHASESRPCQRDRTSDRPMDGAAARRGLSLETAPPYLVRDRDAVYGDGLQRRLTSLGMDQVLTAPRNPWQTAATERVIDSIRRECLDHVIVLSEYLFRRTLASYFHFTIVGARICRWPWIAPNPDQSYRPSGGRWPRSRKWVDYIITTSGWPHDLRCRDVSANRIT